MSWRRFQREAREESSALRRADRHRDLAVRGVELLRLFSFLKIWNYSNIINPMWFCMMY